MNQSDLKHVISEVLLRELNEADTEYEYAQGKKWGMKDLLSDTKRDLSNFPPAFVKGYKEIQREGWWQRFNAKLTDYLARMGSSRLR